LYAIIEFQEKIVACPYTTASIRPSWQTPFPRGH